MNDETPGSGTQAATPEQNKLSAVVSAQPRNLPQQVAGRYELQDVLAEGGMGKVHRAWDHVLQRTIAVKLLLDKAATQRVINRFNYEAHITGQLQHPSIPPVYDMGTTPDGLPFLVMKLIDGRTLDDLIKNPRGKLNILGIFEAIGQAIGYTHSHAVIHRDLKPVNVMVGAFGEVQVMDWGIAKVLDRQAVLRQEPGEAPNTTHTLGTHSHTPQNSDSDTRDGDCMGTPAYMPPEQALGTIDKIDERSDVFGLGGILCAMLTSKPVFIGGDAETTRQLSAQGKVQDAYSRLEACGAEPGVIALAKRCLAVEPSERPANGYEVAKIAAQLRADAEERARQAEIGKARSDTRRRSLAWSATAVFAVLSAGFAVSWKQRNRARAAEQEKGKQLELTLAEEKRAITAEKATAQQLSRAELKEKELETALETSEKNLTLAIAAHKRLAEMDKSGIRVRAESQERVLLSQTLASQLSLLQEVVRQNNPLPKQIRIRLQIGEIHELLDDLTSAQLQYETALDLAKQLPDQEVKDSDDQKVRVECSGMLQRVTLKLTQPDLLRDLLARVEKLESQIRNIGDGLPDGASVRNAYAQARTELSAVRTRIEQNELNRADTELNTVSASIDKIGEKVAIGHVGDAREKLKLYRLAEALLAANRAIKLSPSAEAYTARSVAHHGLHKFRLALTDAELAVKANPTSSEAYIARSRANDENNEFRNAVRDGERATELAPNSADAWAALGEAQADNKDLVAAMKSARKSVSLDPNLGIAHRTVGYVFSKREEYKTAMEHFSRAIEVEPKFASAYNDRGFSQQQLKEYAGAIRDYSQAIEIAPYASSGYLNRLAVHSELKKYKDAIADYDRLIELDYQTGLMYNGRGHMYNQLKQYNNAIRDFEKTIELLPKDTLGYVNLGWTLNEIGQHNRAIDILNQAIALDPNNSGAYFNRGHAYEKLGKTANAADDIKRAKELDRQGHSWLPMPPSKPREAAPPPREAK